MNPFLYEHSDPWSDEFVDVESINADSTDAIVASIDAARATTLDASRPRAALTLLRGPAGSGKTHLFARLRRRCGSRAAFVLIRPEIGVEPSMRLLLAKVVEALGRAAFGTEQRQLDVIAGSALGVLRGQRAFPMATIEDLQRGSQEQVDAAIEDVLDDVEEVHADLSLNYLEQLLRVPFAKSGARRAAMTWLAGNAPTEAQLRKLGVTGMLADAQVVPALRTLALVCALHGPLVLVFDQLENLYDAEDRPDRINAYGNLVSELFDSVPGIVMVQMALDSEWSRRIRPVLSLPQVSRLESDSRMIELPNAAQRLELVRAWMAQLPEPERAPFSETQLQIWREQPGLTPRMLLIACRRVLAGEVDAPAVEGSSLDPAPDAPVVEADSPDDELAERLAALWEETLRSARAAIHRFQSDEAPVPPERIVGGVVCVGRLMKMSARADRAPVNPSVHLRLDEAELDVGVLQIRGAGAMGRVLQAATAAAAMRPVLIVREDALAIPSTWKTVEQRRRELEAAPHGSWLDLDREELAQLLALHDFESMARSGDLSASDGSVIPEEVALVWLESGIDWREWRFATACAVGLSGATPGRRPGAASQVVEASTVEAPVEPSAPSTPHTESLAALQALRRLHLASVDRLVRETRAADPQATRSAVIESLERASGEVRWLGRGLVCTQEVGS